MDRLKETESYKSLTSGQQEELEKAVNAASGTSSSAEKECDSMNISLTNASGVKTAIDQAVSALAEAKAHAGGYDYSPEGSCGFSDSVTAYRTASLTCRVWPKSAANSSQPSASLPRGRLHSAPEQAS